MKKLLLSILAIASLIIAGSGIAGSRHHNDQLHSFIDRAKVLKVVPVYREYGHHDRRSHRDGHADYADAGKYSKSAQKVVSEHGYYNDHRRDYRELTGYKVKYRYRDNKYWTFMHKHPGHHIDIKVKISPIG